MQIGSKKYGFPVLGGVKFSDTFDRTNSVDNSFGDPTNWIANWTAQGFNIVGNQAQTKCLVNNNVGSKAYLKSKIFNDNYFVEVTYYGLSGGSIAGIMGDDDGSGQARAFGLEFFGGSVQSRVYSGGPDAYPTTWVNYTTASDTIPAIGQKIRMEFSGLNCICKVNGAPLFNITRSLSRVAPFGAGMFWKNATVGVGSMAWDNFSVGYL